LATKRAAWDITNRAQAPAAFVFLSIRCPERGGVAGSNRAFPKKRALIAGNFHRLAVVWLAGSLVGQRFRRLQVLLQSGRVFVIQNTQNRDGAAVQAKLDELIRVSAARNALIGIETLTQEEIEAIRATCVAKAHRAANGGQKVANKKAKNGDE
jgi:hypothetical protein